MKISSMNLDFNVYCDRGADNYQLFQQLRAKDSNVFLMNRFDVDNTAPRPESYIEDIEAAQGTNVHLVAIVCVCGLKECV